MAEPQAKPLGRPVTYTKELADEILAALSEGSSLRDIAKDLDIPASTVRGWVVDNREGFAERYARARILQAQAWEDAILATAADGSKDTVIKYGRDGSEYEAPDNEWINRSKLIVDTQKWLLAKLHPATYGDKIQQEITGKDGEPLTISWAGHPPNTPAA